MGGRLVKCDFRSHSGSYQSSAWIQNSSSSRVWQYSITHSNLIYFDVQFHIRFHIHLHNKFGTQLHIQILLNLMYNFIFCSTFIYIIDLAFNYKYKSNFTLMYNFTFSSPFIYIIELAFNCAFKS